MKPFDLKINRFGNWNLPQQQLSLFNSKSGDSLSVILIEKGLKKEKNEVRYQNVLSSNSRNWSPNN